MVGLPGAHGWPSWPCHGGRPRTRRVRSTSRRILLAFYAGTVVLVLAASLFMRGELNDAAGGDRRSPPRWRFPLTA